VVLALVLEVIIQIIMIQIIMEIMIQDEIMIQKMIFLIFSLTQKMHSPNGKLTVMLMEYQIKMMMIVVMYSKLALAVIRQR